MVTVLTDEAQPVTISVSYSWWRIALIGAAMGILYWAITFLVGRLVIDPMFCGSSVNAAACANSVGLSGNVAGILVAVVGLFVLVGLKVLRPLIVAVAAAVVLWGLSGWTNGLAWGEIAFWSALLYSLTYVLFSWISRYNKSVPVLITVVLTVVVARIILSV